jgi:peptidoglycan/xylan/chitin deacetylase (PgdA/CDA1 family)
MSASKPYSERGGSLPPSTEQEQSGTGFAWIRRVLAMLSPGGPSGRLTIMIFHRVRERPDDLYPEEIHASTFRERMTWIRSWFNVLPLDEAVASLERGSLPERALAITFDDGYADNATVALPILRALGLPATFFVATAFLDGGRMWNDTVIEAVRGETALQLDLSKLGLGVHSTGSLEARRNAIEAILTQLKYLAPDERLERIDAIAAMTAAELPSNLMMTSEQLRSLAAAGMTIGGHTVSHPILARLDDSSARREIADGRDALEHLVRQPIKLFAYPNGKPGSDYSMAHVRMAKDLGFSGAVCTSKGAARAGDSSYELPRCTPWGHTPARWGWWFARNFSARAERVAA